MARRQEKKIIKVIYFDEGTATDYIYIMDGGKSENKNENIVTKTTNIAAKAEAKAEGRFKIFSFLSANASAGVQSELSREGNTIISKAIQNTILTDYLIEIEKEESKKYIKKFYNCMLYPYPESFAYYKMLTPYMIMTEGKVAVDKDMTLNPALMDEALLKGRGYYELIAEEGDVKSVLRFNIHAFRNSYGMSDLIKMKLDFHAIEVGEVKESYLTFASEFEKTDKIVSGFDIVNGTKQDEKLKVYDVLLAGVSK